MKFRKYQHIERFGTDEVQDIELGKCYLFPKIDGTNGSVWMNENGIGCGSRRRELSLDADNQGFMAYILNDKRVIDYLRKHPTHRLFGEWLVPHSLKTYRKEAWRKFYIFDVTIDRDEETVDYLTYETYSEFLNEFELDYIPPIAIVKNGSYEQFVDQLEKNVFLVEDGKGAGEGIVIKNYDFYNRFGRQTWAKIVRSEFKEVHTKTNGKKMVEEEIAIEFCTDAFIEKTYAKIVNAENGWRSEYIPRLLETVYYDLITEESWQFIKKHKNPTINYKTLKHFITQKIKNTKVEIFS